MTSNWLRLTLAAALVSLVASMVYAMVIQPQQITSYEACVAADYQVVTGDPNLCITPDGRSFEESET